MRVLKSALLSVALLLPLSATAEQLAQPGDAPILTVSGDFSNQNSDNAAIFDMEMLQALPQSSFTTTTIWTDGPQEFTGVKVDDLLRDLGISAGSVKVTAINDYAVEIPVAELLGSEALLAYLRNGEAMSIRDKGPLWLVYPYDADDKFRNEVIYSRSVWQVDRMILSE